MQRDFIPNGYIKLNPLHFLVGLFYNYYKGDTKEFVDYSYIINF